MVAVLICLSLLAACRSFEISRTTSTAEQGEFDLSLQRFERDTLTPLDGMWEFYPRQLLHSEEDFLSAGESVYMEIPDSWNEVMGSAEGYGTYRLKLMLPSNSSELGLLLGGQNCAMKVFINGAEVAQMGVVATDSDGYKPDVRDIFISLPTANEQADAEISVVIQIANFHHRSGGFVESAYIGNYNDLINYISSENAQHSLVIGILFFVAFANMFFFFFNRNKKIYLIFSILTLIFMVREIVRDTHIINLLFSNLSYEVYVGLEYITFFFMVSLAFHFILFLSTDVKKHKFIIIVLHSIATVCSVLVLVLPFITATEIVPYYQGVILVGFVYMIAALIFDRSKQRRAEKLLILATIVITLATAVHGILVTRFIISGPLLDQLGFLAVILLQSGFLLRQFSISLYKAERLSVSFRRFVPEQFLKLLHRQDITEVSLGEHTQREMSVFFADIRDFTALSETMSPQDNFRFINSYLEYVGPLIRKNSGFIDKYIGDAVMGIFPENPANAVRAAVEFHTNLREYNAGRQDSGFQPLRIGVGIHTGLLMLGTIGETERIDTTVISDSVNLASRVEGMTKQLGVIALITEHTYSAMSEEDRGQFHFRRLHCMQVKGKEERVFAYEILDCYPSDKIEKYMASLESFNDAMAFYNEGKFEQARPYFEKVLSVNPDDAAARYYLTNQV